MKRHEHRSGASQCKRCGITPSERDPFCPPGFWMTKAETAEWDAVPCDDAGSQYAKYTMLERRFRERPMGTSLVRSPAASGQKETTK